MKLEGKKIAIISHDDLDGIISAVLIWKIKRGKIFFTNPVDVFDLLNKLKGFDTYVICDLEVSKLEKKNRRIYVFDHHIPINKKVWETYFNSWLLGYKNYTCTAKLIYDLLKTNWDWMVGIAIIADKAEETDFIKYLNKRYGDLNFYVEGLNAGLVFNKRKKIVSMLKRADNINDLDKEELANWRESLEKLINYYIDKFNREKEEFEKVVIFTFSDDKHKKITSLLANKFSEFCKKTIFVLKEETDKYKVSARSKEFDLNALSNELFRDIGSGGGHKRAIGGWIKKEYIDIFKERIKKLIQ